MGISAASGRDHAGKAHQGLPGWHPGGESARSRGGRRRARRLRRPVRLRQDHRAAHGRGPGADHRRLRPDRRSGREPSPAQEPRHRDGLPELRPLPAHERVQEHGLRAEAPEVRASRDRPPRAGRSQGPRPRGRARQAAANPVGRPAPAGRHGAGDRARAAGIPDGRAPVEPGREAARRDAGRDRADPARPRGDDDLRHPRSGRGDDTRRPRRRHARRCPAAVRRPPDALRPADEPLRRRVHRLTGDEPRRRRPRPRRRRRWPSTSASTASPSTTSS